MSSFNFERLFLLPTLLPVNVSGLIPDAYLACGAINSSEAWLDSSSLNEHQADIRILA